MVVRGRWASPVWIWGLAGALAVAAGAFASLGGEEIPALIVLTGALAGATLGALLWYQRVDRDAFSPLVLAGVFYFLGFAVGGVYAFTQLPLGLYDERLFLLYQQPAVLKTMALALVAWTGFVFGYRIGVWNWLLELLPRLRVEPLGSIGPAQLVALYVAGWGARAVTAASGGYFGYSSDAPTIVSTGGSWITTALALLPSLVTLYIGAFDLRERGRRLGKLFAILFALELAWALPSGARREVIALVLAVAAILYYSPGGLRRGTVVALVGISCFIVFPLATSYRSNDANYGRDTAAALGQAAADLAQQRPQGFVETGLASTVSRFSDAASVAIAVEQGSGNSPVRPGDTYSYAFTSFLPRSLFPEKPDPGRFGNVFARATGLTGPGDLQTSIAVTHPGEFFINFGFLGVLLGMPLVGGAYRLISEILANRRGDPALTALYALIAWPLVESHETIVAAGVAGAFKLLLVLLPLLIVSTALVRRRA